MTASFLNSASNLFLSPHSSGDNPLRRATRPRAGLAELTLAIF